MTRTLKSRGFSRVSRHGELVLGKQLPNGCRIYQESNRPTPEVFSVYNERGQLLGEGDLEEATAAAEENRVLPAALDWSPTIESLEWIWSAAVRAGAPAYCVERPEDVQLLVLASNLFLVADASSNPRGRRELAWWDYAALVRDYGSRTSKGIQLLRLRPLLPPEIYR